MCSKGCGRNRAEGQRYCKECRAAAEKKRRNRKRDEYISLVADRAKLLALQIERFNGEQPGRAVQA